jgi:2-polyprenyl-6-methoxyphenol hydroxylase-like FAD-dependent oxidoreductase
MHVIIIGAGIGGLALAHGLQEAGIGVIVYERDRHRRERLQGYRIHLAPYGCRALHECLPASVYHRFVSTSGKPNRCLSFFDEHLRNLLTLDTEEIDVDVDDPVNSYKSASRIVLREVLLTGLGEAVRFGKQFTEYEVQADGRVRVRFTDGSQDAGDVLVGADGTNSRVQQQYLPDGGRIDTGAVAIAGKLPLDDDTNRLLPWQFTAGGGMVLAPGGLASFLAVHQFRNPRDGEQPVEDLIFDNTRDYVMWNILGRWQRFGSESELRDMTPQRLRDLVRHRIDRWHPHLVSMVEQTSPDTIALLPLRSSRKPAPWQPSTVTLVGDAIHAMPPTAGAGANTALLDANNLRTELIAAHQGQLTIPEAIGHYEDRMLKESFTYLATAERNLKSATNDNRFALGVKRSALKAVSRIGPIRRMMTRSIAK